MGKRFPYKKVTISDIAKAAGVSPTTVSRVINYPELVESETKKSILAIMDNLKYINPKKKNINKFSGPERQIIALMIPNDENPYYQTLISMVEKRLTSSGYLLLLCIYNNDAENINAHLLNLMNQGISGCIMSYINPQDNVPLVSEFVKKIPSVAFQANIEDIDSVEANEESGSYEMLEHLIQLGHKKIAFVGYFSNLMAYERRFAAYKKIHKDYNLPLRSEYICEYKGHTGLDFQTSYREGCRLLSLPDRPTAIHCFNLKVAIGVYAAIRDFKLRIPEDISLSGFDDLQLTQLFTPPLSVVGVPMDSMVSTAISYLKQRIEGGPDMPKQHIMFPTSLYQRSSTGPAPF
jgi:DNA-binding LacI/PurR family transcriptional regulator